MSEQNNQFLPEQVDEQVEALSQAQIGTKHESLSSARLVANLHQVYREEAEIGEQVWARLARYAVERRRSVALTPELSAPAPDDPNAAGGQRARALLNQQPLFSTLSGEKSDMRPTEQQPTQTFLLQREPGTLQEERPRSERMSSIQQRERISSQRKRLPRFLGLAAAVLVGVVLISSMALVLTVLKGNTPNTGTGSHAPTSTVKVSPTTATSSVPPECRDVQDQGEETLCAQHKETILNITKKFSGHEVTFVRAYADSSRLILIYTPKDSPHSDVVSFLSVKIQQGITLTGGNSVTYENPKTHQWYYAVNFETRGVPAGTTTLHIEGIVDAFSGASTPLGFTTPFHAAQKNVAVHQTLTSHGVALTLDHLILAGSTATAYFKSSSSAQYGLFVRAISINGQQLADVNAGSTGFWEGPGTFIMNLHQSLLNQPGTWMIPVQQITPGGTSAIHWTFSFTVQG